MEANLAGQMKCIGTLYAWWVPVMGDLLCGYAVSAIEARRRINVAITRYYAAGEVTSLETSKTVH